MTKQTSKLYKLKLTFLASAIMAFSGCATPSQPIEFDKIRTAQYYQKFKSENPDYNWKFIEETYNQ